MAERAAELAAISLAFDTALPLERRNALSVLARGRGIALRDESDSAGAPTHIVAERGDAALLSARNLANLQRGAQLVLPAWLEVIYRLNFMPYANGYSPDEKRFLAGTVICTSGVRGRCARSALTL